MSDSPFSKFFPDKTGPGWIIFGIVLTVAARGLIAGLIKFIWNKLRSTFSKLTTPVERAFARAAWTAKDGWIDREYCLAQSKNQTLEEFRKEMKSKVFSDTFLTLFFTPLSPSLLELTLQIIRVFVGKGELPFQTRWPFLRFVKRIRPRVFLQYRLPNENPKNFKTLYPEVEEAMLDLNNKTIERVIMYKDHIRQMKKAGFDGFVLTLDKKLSEDEIDLLDDLFVAADKIGGFKLAFSFGGLNVGRGLLKKYSFAFEKHSYFRVYGRPVIFVEKLELHEVWDEWKSVDVNPYIYAWAGPHVINENFFKDFKNADGLCLGGVKKEDEIKMESELCKNARSTNHIYARCVTSDFYVRNTITTFVKRLDNALKSNPDFMIMGTWSRAVCLDPDSNTDVFEYEYADPERISHTEWFALVKYYNHEYKTGEESAEIEKWWLELPNLTDDEFVDSLNIREDKIDIFKQTWIPKFNAGKIDREVLHYFMRVTNALPIEKDRRENSKFAKNESEPSNLANLLQILLATVSKEDETGEDDSGPSNYRPHSTNAHLSIVDETGKNETGPSNYQPYSTNARLSTEDETGKNESGPSNYRPSPTDSDLMEWTGIDFNTAVHELLIDEFNKRKEKYIQYYMEKEKFTREILCLYIKVEVNNFKRLAEKLENKGKDVQDEPGPSNSTNKDV